jgi:hypothetical protein
MLLGMGGLLFLVILMWQEAVHMLQNSDVTVKHFCPAVVDGPKL